MTDCAISCVVEGHGEVEAVPVLLRRIAARVAPSLGLQIPKPIRIPKGRLLKAGELERAVEFAVRKLAGPGAVLVLVDADDDCPATEAPKLLHRARPIAGTKPVAVVLARSEYESWFLAAATSLSGRRGLRQNLSAPSSPESIRGAKEWLSNNMTGTRVYSETLDQAALTAVMDIVVARSAPSFDKCCRDIARLIEFLGAALAPASN